jgi:hypothetical protein
MSADIRMSADIHIHTLPQHTYASTHYHNIHTHKRLMFLQTPKGLPVNSESKAVRSGTHSCPAGQVVGKARIEQAFGLLEGLIVVSNLIGRQVETFTLKALRKNSEPGLGLQDTSTTVYLIIRFSRTILGNGPF